MNEWYLELLDKTSTKEELNKMFNLIKTFEDVCKHLQIEPTTERMKQVIQIVIEK